MSIRVVLVEDQMLVRQGIRSLLALDSSVEVVAECDDGAQVINTLTINSADIVLMDIRMPEMTGIDALRAMRDHNIDTPVIMLTTFDDHELVTQAMQSGAKGYLLKDVSLETLISAIKSVVNGETLIQPSVTEKVLKGLQGLEVNFESFEQPETLSPKEIEILRLVAAGYSNKEISEAMFKSTGTVKNQVSAIMAKMGVRDRTRAVLKALELGWL
ncbi:MULTISPECIES: response regulator transcription factor [Alteromonas]|jgi:DNA-binding NarL/FixJ family response regulator|uniref:LuxR family transcriptional regulator n=2 Tax=Alteromonas stellipolaris TaxID=233316 RepID=A0AAW7Z535_9ALTE|nr:MULTISPECIES: response regulator transcription factor [Alteromonas]AMJ91735.1 LuxR family transcriptional regulator [Alteromonas sp. Mac2]ALM89425.1 Two-component system regulatory protein [Alteromonas stellipolaris LMG 21856]AMJ75447.1 LuxR family transcriptional regulator [Alteromonas stellipolaris]AMJ87870.1 LuxR family transcriptional regulator [Alteromonas sp. Mac1]AMJ95579.1 LuxR family transcriptional regulator [Alteromonas stellipolaris]